MHTSRLAALALSLTAAFMPHAASADAVLPPFSLGIPNASNAYGLELNQWFVFTNAVAAGTIIDGALSQSGGSTYFPSATQLSRTTDNSQATNGKLASAFARVGPNSLGASSSAGSPLDSTGTSSIAVGQSWITYAALLDQNTSVQFNLKLDGHLATTGDRALGADRSGAAVTALAFGSDSPYNSGNT